MPNEVREKQLNDMRLNLLHWNTNSKERVHIGMIFIISRHLSLDNYQCNARFWSLTRFWSLSIVTYKPLRRDVSVPKQISLEEVASVQSGKDG